MSFVSKEKQAGRKAAETARLNKIANTDIKALQDLCNEIINKEYSLDDDTSIEAIIAREIGKTTWKSFCRFGDKRNATNGLILKWIDNKAVPLDTQALFINEQYGTDISPDQLANFMLEYSTGKSNWPNYRELEDLKKTFKQVAGFRWNIKFARLKIISAAEKASDQKDYF